MEISDRVGKNTAGCFGTSTLYTILKLGIAEGVDIAFQSLSIKP